MTDAVVKPNTPTSRIPHYRGLDGLRAIAFLLVFSVHITPPVVDKVWGRVTGGYLGLDLFFVLSGFLITSILVTEYAKTGAVNLKKFYLRRSIRLLPVVLLFVIAVFILTSVDSVFKVSGADSRRQALGALSYFYNWIAIYSTNRGHDVGFVGPLWSLSVEEQFYLIFPAALLFSLRRGRRRSRVLSTTDGVIDRTDVAAHLRTTVKALVGALLVSNVLIVSIGWLFSGRDSYERAMWGTDTRASGFILGALAAIVRIAYPSLYAKITPHLRWAGPLAAVVFFVSCMTFPEKPSTLPFAGGLLMADLCVVALVLAAVERTTPWLSFVFELRPLRWIGKVSYGAYVVHFMLVWRFFLKDESFFRIPFPPILAMTLVIAAISFYAIEQPLARSLRRRWAL